METLELQVQRSLKQLERKSDDLEKYIYLIQLLDTNETLFYKLLSTDPARFLPIVYTPTVGKACLEFGHIFRRPRGMYVSIDRKGHVKEVLSNWPVRDVRVICVSTGERILGLGDLGANGMGIPIGKLQLYTACASVPPGFLLPVLLDCGTNNEKLLADPLYLGQKRKRPTTEELDGFVDEFVRAVQEVFPKCCIHFEDWKGTDAVRLLAKYTGEVSCYNDDIQGTGGVAVAGLYSAIKLSGSALGDQRVLFLGAGSAAIGIANMIVLAMKLEDLTEEEAQSRISMFDADGLIEPSRVNLLPEQKIYARPHAPSKDLVAAIESLKPSVLIGVSTVGGAFNQKVIEAMAKINDRPVIFALSNPTELAECTAEQAYRWSQGRALYAAGVQFPPVEFDGRKYQPGQVNNCYIFPAVGLAVVATEARRVPDDLFIEAAKACSGQVDHHDLAQGMLFPPQRDIVRVETAIALRVIERIYKLGIAGVPSPRDVPAYLNSLLYKPEYTTG